MFAYRQLLNKLEKVFRLRAFLSFWSFYKSISWLIDLLTFDTYLQFSTMT